jgi:hypothetical protein
MVSRSTMLLVVRRLDVMNQVCILKLGWKLSSGANDW